MSTELDHIAEAVANRLRRTRHLETLTRRDQFRLALAGAMLTSDGRLMSDRLRSITLVADCLMADDPVAEWEKCNPPFSALAGPITMESLEPDRLNDMAMARVGTAFAPILNDLTRVPRPDGVRWLGVVDERTADFRRATMEEIRRHGEQAVRVIAPESPFACPQCGPVETVDLVGSEAPTCSGCGRQVDAVESEAP